MDIQKFIDDFREAVELDDDVQLDASTNFRDLDNWGSLSYLNVILMMDEEYDKQIPEGEFKKLNTIGDIIEYLDRN